MAATIEKKCATCKQPMTVRLADHKRGWGKFCSKSCKALKQEQRTGQYARYRNPRDAGPDGIGGRLFYANFSNEEGTDV